MNANPTEICDLPDNDSLLEMTAEIVTAMVTNHSVSVERLPSLIHSVHAALSGLGQEAPGTADESKPAPAVTSRKSLANPEIIVSMIDGKSYSSLKRHITKHGYTPESYREAFGLKVDYPMVAPGYSERRREIAKKLGLGRKAAVPEETPPKKTRKPRAAQKEVVAAGE